MEFEQLSMFQETGFKMKKVKPMKILVACEESQAVCIELRKLGHEAYSADIQECSGGFPQYHILGDVIPLINGDCKFNTMDGVQHEIVGGWGMLIAHPPCTYMSKAGACRMYPKAGEIDKERFEKAMKAKEFFMQFYNCNCDKIVIENPTPLKCVGLPEPTQVIQPYEYGHPYSKRTLLWLKGLNPIKPTKVLMEYKPFMPSNTGGFSRGGGGARGVAHDAKTASKTFHGIAKAIAEQLAGDARDYVE